MGGVAKTTGGGTRGSRMASRKEGAGEDSREHERAGRRISGNGGAGRQKLNACDIRPSLSFAREIANVEGDTGGLAINQGGYVK